MGFGAGSQKKNKIMLQRNSMDQLMYLKRGCRIKREPYRRNSKSKTSEKQQDYSKSFLAVLRFL